MVAFNKCGHTSIVNSFMTAPGSPVDRAATQLRKDTLIGNYHKAQQWPEPVVTIAYFRHPLARIASVWNHLIRHNWYTSFKELGFTKEMPFDAFCKHLLFIRDDFLDPHLEEQSISFRACRAWLGDTAIYRLDEISTAWPQMCRTWDLDCTTNVAHMNRRDYPEGKPWTAMYKDKQVMFDLLHMYREDLQIWSDRKTP
jgi:hypothetical protein